MANKKICTWSANISMSKHYFCKIFVNVYQYPSTLEELYMAYCISTIKFPTIYPVQEEEDFLTIGDHAKPIVIPVWQPKPSFSCLRRLLVES